MEIPQALRLTAEDIRRLATSHLEALTGLPANNFSSWTHKRGISERNLDRIAERLRITKGELLQGIELRRKDAIAARESNSKAVALSMFLDGRLTPAAIEPSPPVMYGRRSTDSPLEREPPVESTA